MDKNTGLYIVFGFLLLCIFLSLDKKEGFLVIREDLFETECAEGHESCNVFLSGQEGVECADPGDKHLYNIPQEGRSKFTGSGFNMDPTSCSASAYANDETLGSQECDSEGQRYTLTGCSAYCTGPSSHPEYTINSPPDSIEPGSVQAVQGDSITCADGYTPAINTCFNKQTGGVSGEGHDSCNGEDLEWFGEDDGIKIYCDNPGGTYKIMGCEASCYPRTGDHVGDYLINVEDISEDDYSGNKERIETMENRSSAGLGDKVIHDSFPYSEPTDSIFAPNDTFNVLLNPESGWSFRGDDITEHCNIMGSDDIKNKYFVNGLYPDCDSTREECLNFNIVYSSEAPVNLEELREELPVENIFPEDQIPDQDTPEGLADLNKYKNALYYFRRFKNSDGNNEIEAQIRCDIDPTSDFHCSFVEQDLATEYCESLPLIGGGGDGCNGSNRTKKTPDEISSIPLEQIQEAQDTGVGDINFQSPCCKWTGVELPTGYAQDIFGSDFNMDDFLNADSNSCENNGMQGENDTFPLSAGTRQNRQCGTYTTPNITGANGESFGITFIHNYHRTDADCNQQNYGSGKNVCYCPQRDDGTFWDFNYWPVGGSSSQWSSSNADGQIACKRN